MPFGGGVFLNATLTGVLCVACPCQCRELADLKKASAASDNAIKVSGCGTQAHAQI